MNHGFEDLPIEFTGYEYLEGGWKRETTRMGTISELLEIWDIDNRFEMCEMTQVLRHLREAMRQLHEKGQSEDQKE